MLEVDGINLWAVLTVWVMYLAVGAFWYSPAGFAKKWQKHTGFDIMKIPTKQANKILLSVSVSGLIQAITLAVIFHSLAVTDVAQGLLIGGVIWLGLVAATTVGTTLYQKRSWAFLWLNAAYFLVVMLIASVIFTLFK